MARKRVSEKEIVVSAPVPVRHKLATPRAPAAEQIAHLAYSYWEARGYQGGSPEEDWLRAEQQLRVQISAT